MSSSSRTTQRLRIQDLSDKSGMSIRNIQKYIGLGLMRPPVGRTRMAYYLQEHLDDLLDIRELMRKEGSLARVGELMAERRRKVAEEEASRVAQGPLVDSLSRLSKMAFVEDMLVAVSRVLDVSDSAKSLLMHDIRKAFDRARFGTAESAPMGDGYRQRGRFSEDGDANRAAA